MTLTSIVGLIVALVIITSATFFIIKKKSPPAKLPVPEIAPSVRYSANEYPTNKFWVMEPWTWSEYSHQKFDGVYDRETGEITPTKVWDAPDKIRVTNIPYFMPNNPEQLAIARFHTQWGEVATSASANLLLKETLLERSGFVGDVEVIGEAGNASCPDIYAPEPLITKNPIAGETLDVVSDVVTFGGSKFIFKTRYKTVKIDGNFLYTSLLENVGNPGQETAYYHCFDGDLFWIMYGLVDVDGKILNGFIATRVKQGKN